MVRRAIDKKGELSLTVVVVAILALVVLVVLIYIFTKSAQRSSNTFGSCAINGGVCKPANSCDGKQLGGSCDGGQVCCPRTDWLCEQDSNGNCCEDNEKAVNGVCVAK